MTVHFVESADFRRQTSLLEVISVCVGGGACVHMSACTHSCARVCACVCALVCVERSAGAISGYNHLHVCLDLLTAVVFVVSFIPVG